MTCSETIKTLSHAQAQEIPAPEEAPLTETAPQLAEIDLKALQKKATQALQACVAGLAKVKEERSRSPRSKSKDPEPRAAS